MASDIKVRGRFEYVVSGFEDGGSMQWKLGGLQKLGEKKLKQNILHGNQKDLTPLTSYLQPNEANFGCWLPGL